MTKISVGSDVDAYCTKCKLVLNHTIVTMEGPRPRRVRCTTCGGTHNFRPTKPVPKGTAPKKKEKAKAPRKVKQTWDDIVQQSSQKPRKSYSMSGNYSEGDWIQHAKFGLGCVESVVPPNRITVRFADNIVKTLACNYRN
jgi:hypothetical protein